VYDTLNRLQTLTPPAAISSGNFGFSYDALSRRTQMTRPNGLKSVYAYDNLSRLLSVLHQSGSTTLDGAVYTVDNAGNRLTRTPQPSGTSSAFGYDNIYQLLSVTQGSNTTESYTYDPVGNRLSSLGVSPYVNNMSNELTSKPGTTYTYDNDGNTATKVDSTGTTTYNWDFENRMKSVTLPANGGTVTFKYDPFGRRIYKSSSSGTSVFAYDGDNLVEETNSSGTAVARYSQALNIDEPLAMLRSATTNYYEQDGVGSITSLSSGTGGLVQTYGYDSFGKQTSSSGSLTNPFQYTAREFDPETSLYYYRARHFDPTSGRFLSEDPMGFSGGEDFYSYVFNDPIYLTDPSGLQAGDYTRKYKCNILGICIRTHPLGARNYKPPKQQPCPLVTKDFNGFNRCYDDEFPNNLPGAWAKASTKPYTGALPSNPNQEPGIPGVGLGNVVDTLGEAAEHAILDCLKKYPLAALDPRFPPGLNIGKMSSANWWDRLGNFLGFDSPIF